MGGAGYSCVLASRRAEPALMLQVLNRRELRGRTKHNGKEGKNVATSFDSRLDEP